MSLIFTSLVASEEALLSFLLTFTRSICQYCMRWQLLRAITCTTPGAGARIRLQTAMHKTQIQVHGSVGGLDCVGGCPRKGLSQDEPRDAIWGDTQPRLTIRHPDPVMFSHGYQQDARDSD